MELLLSQERSAHSLQLSQLQQQVEALEADKNAAVQNYDDLSKSMQCASSKADGATSQATQLQLEIDAVKQVQPPLHSSAVHRDVMVNSVLQLLAHTSAIRLEHPVLSQGCEKLLQTFHSWAKACSVAIAYRSQL